MCWFYQALDGRFKFPMTDALFTFDFTLDTFSGINPTVDLLLHGRKWTFGSSCKRANFEINKNIWANS